MCELQTLNLTYLKREVYSLQLESLLEVCYYILRHIFLLVKNTLQMLQIWTHAWPIMEDVNINVRTTMAALCVSATLDSSLQQTDKNVKVNSLITCLLHTTFKEAMPYCKTTTIASEFWWQIVFFFKMDCTITTATSYHYHRSHRIYPWLFHGLHKIVIPRILVRCDHNCIVNNVNMWKCQMSAYPPVFKAIDYYLQAFAIHLRQPHQIMQLRNWKRISQRKFLVEILMCRKQWCCLCWYYHCIHTL